MEYGAEIVYYVPRPRSRILQSRVDCRPRLQTSEYDMLFSGRGAYTIFLHTPARKFAKTCTICGREIADESRHVLKTRACNMQLPGRKARMFWRKLLANLYNISGFLEVMLEKSV